MYFLVWRYAQQFLKSFKGPSPVTTVADAWLRCFSPKKYKQTTMCAKVHSLSSCKYLKLFYQKSGRFIRNALCKLRIIYFLLSVLPSSSRLQHVRVIEGNSEQDLHIRSKLAYFFQSSGRIYWIDWALVSSS